MAGRGKSAPRSGGLTATDIAWCGQIEPAQRAAWARADRLKKNGPWTTRDAIETAIAFAIPSGIHATKVWDKVRPAVQDLILKGKEDQIWLVVAQVGGDHRAVAGPAAAAKAAATLDVDVRVRDTSAVVKEAKRRYAEKVGAQAAVVQPLPRREPQSSQGG
jgi:hypothetical protein